MRFASVFLTNPPGPLYIIQKKQPSQAPCRGAKSLECAASAVPCSSSPSAWGLPPEHNHPRPRPPSCNPLRSPTSAPLCLRPPQGVCRLWRGILGKRAGMCKLRCDISRAIPSAMHLHIASKLRRPEKITVSHTPAPMSAGTGRRLFRRRQGADHRPTIESEVLV